MNVGLNNPNPSALPLVGGVAKIFVAEMVEKGEFARSSSHAFIG